MHAARPCPAGFRRWWRRLLLISLTLAGVIRGGSAEPDAVSRVREFLESPPRVESLLLERRLASTPMAFRNAGEARRYLSRLAPGQAVSHPSTSWYELRYQAETPAFFLRSIADPADYGRTDGVRLVPFAGRYAGQWWSILEVTPGQVHFLNSPEGLDVDTAGVTNTYFRGNERWALEYFRLGMFELLPETVRWSDRQPGSFTGRSEHGTACEGVVRGGSNDRESLIDFSPGPEAWRKRIRVEWELTAGRWLPRALEIDLQAAETGAGTGPVPYAGFSVRDLVIAPALLPRDHFSPEPYLTTNDLWVEVEGGERYVLSMRGTNLVRNWAPTVEASTDYRRLLRWIFLGALGVALLWMGGRYFSEWRRRLRRVSFHAEKP